MRETRSAYRILVYRPLEVQSPVKQKLGWNDNVKVDLRKIYPILSRLNPVQGLLSFVQDKGKLLPIADWRS
jgi:hypothetical protein